MRRVSAVADGESFRHRRRSLLKYECRVQSAESISRQPGDFSSRLFDYSGLLLELLFTTARCRCQPPQCPAKSTARRRREASPRRRTSRRPPMRAPRGRRATTPRPSFSPAAARRSSSSAAAPRRSSGGSMVRATHRAPSAAARGVPSYVTSRISLHHSHGRNQTIHQTASCITPFPSFSIMGTAELQRLSSPASTSLVPNSIMSLFGDMEH